MAGETHRSYRCTVNGCDRRCESHHATLIREEMMTDRHGNERRHTVKGQGLGTWHCPVHGKTKVRVVMHRHQEGDNA